MPATKTALLVMDMQEEFRDMGGKDTLSNVLKLVELFGEKGWPRAFTQHGHPPSDFSEPVTNQLVRKWGADGSIHKGSSAWQLMPEITNILTEGDRVVHKNVYDAFLGVVGKDGKREEKGLEAILREMGVQRLVICGFMTDCCCDTTGRGSFNRGFETWMVGDACGTVDQKQHEAGLKAWAFGYGPVLKTNEVLRRLVKEAA